MSHLRQHPVLYSNLRVSHVPMTQRRKVVVGHHCRRHVRNKEMAKLCKRFRSSSGRRGHGGSVNILKLDRYGPNAHGITYLRSTDAARLEVDPLSAATNGVPVGNSAGQGAQTQGQIQLLASVMDKATEYSPKRKRRGGQRWARRVRSLVDEKQTSRRKRELCRSPFVPADNLHGRCAKRVHTCENSPSRGSCMADVSIQLRKNQPLAFGIFRATVGAPAQHLQLGLTLSPCCRSPVLVSGRIGKPNQLPTICTYSDAACRP